MSGGHRGFLLIEVAVALFILGILGLRLIAPLPTFIEEQKRQQTSDLMRVTIDSLYGFYMARRRFPCPASADSAGREELAAGAALKDGGTCFSRHGLVPASTLGLAGARDGGQRLIDAWGNPIRYSVSHYDGDGDGPDFTTAGGLDSVSWSQLAAELVVCEAPSARDEDCQTGAEVLADQAPVVLLSLGAEGWHDPSDAEVENAGESQLGPYSMPGDNVFVAGPQILSGPQRFDDLVFWISENLFISRLAQAGSLP